MSNEIPNPNMPNMQLPVPRPPHDPQQYVEVIAEYAKAGIRLVFWILLTVLCVGFALGTIIVFTRGVWWFVQLSSEALGI